MTKKEIRKKYTEKRKTLSPDEVLLLSELIFNNLFQYFTIKENQKVHELTLTWQSKYTCRDCDNYRMKLKDIRW